MNGLRIDAFPGGAIGFCIFSFGAAAVVALLIIWRRRARRAEQKLETLVSGMAQQIAAAESRAREGESEQRRQVSEAMQFVNDSMLRMMGEITRTQQGQMDALGGQLRAANRQGEDRLEDMRRSVESRLLSYEERLGGVARTVEERAALSGERMEEMRRTLAGSLDQMSRENRDQLELMRQTVDEKLNATVERRLEASFSVVTRRLEQVTQSLADMQSLTSSVSELGKLVSGEAPLGIFAEAQLGTLLAQMLAPQQYAQHAPVRPGGEPVADYVVVMPGQGHEHTVYLPIDASLPMREYQELLHVQTGGTREEIGAACGLLESAVRMHARRMSEKLIVPPYTTDYAVLFLPNEGLFAQVLHISGLAERIQSESRMVIAGPTTLAALLTSLQMGFRSLAIEQRTQEVTRLLGAVRTDFAAYASLLSRTEKKLRQATEEIESAQKHTQTIAKRLSDVGGLPRGEAEQLLGTEQDSAPDAWD